MKRLLLASALAVALNAHASDFSLVLHGFSKHTNTHSTRTGREWDETNYGLGIRYKVDEDISYQSGFYQNSEHSLSLYGGIDWTPLHLGPLAFGASLGLVTGYETFPVMPMATLVGRASLTDRVDITVRWIPPVTPKVTSVAAVELSIRF